MKKFILLLFLIPVIVYGWIPASYTKTIGFGPTAAPMQRGSVMAPAASALDEIVSWPESRAVFLAENLTIPGTGQGPAIWENLVSGYPNASQGTDVDKPIKGPEGIYFTTVTISQHIICPITISQPFTIVAQVKTAPTVTQEFRFAWDSNGSSYCSLHRRDSGINSCGMYAGSAPGGNQWDLAPLAMATYTAIFCTYNGSSSSFQSESNLSSITVDIGLNGLSGWIIGNRGPRNGGAQHPSNYQYDAIMLFSGNLASAKRQIVLDYLETRR